MGAWACRRGARSGGRRGLAVVAPAPPESCSAPAHGTRGGAHSRNPLACRDRELRGGRPRGAREGQAKAEQQDRRHCCCPGNACVRMAHRDRHAKDWLGCMCQCVHSGPPDLSASSRGSSRTARGIADPVLASMDADSASSKQILDRRKRVLQHPCGGQLGVEHRYPLRFGAREVRVGRGDRARRTPPPPTPAGRERSARAPWRARPVAGEMHSSSVRSGSGPPWRAG